MQLQKRFKYMRTIINIRNKIIHEVKDERIR